MALISEPVSVMCCGGLGKCLLSVVRHTMRSPHVCGILSTHITRNDEFSLVPVYLLGHRSSTVTSPLPAAVGDGGLLI